MIDEMVEMAIKQGHVTMDGVNNLAKKQVSCKDDSLPKSFRAENIDDFENMGYTIEDLCNEELHGERSYISKDGVEGFVGEFGPNSMNKEGNEEDIAKGNEKISAKENFKQNEEDYYQGNVHGNDDIVYGDGVKGKKSNIT